MKERLTGAIILVALLVLLVPELLTGPSPTSSTNPAGPEGAPLRSYTIDLGDSANARRPDAAGPSTAPVTVASDEPVGTASPEPEEGSDASADGGGESGSSAGVAAADAPSSQAPSSSAGTNGAPANADGGSTAQPALGGQVANADAASDDKPRSAFGPNAVSKPPANANAAAGNSHSAGGSSAASSGPSEARRSDVRTPAPSAARTAGSNEARPSASSEAKPVASRPASTGSSSAGGWMVQLGVFASRENAERLAKQVRGKGYPVVVNETSGSGKRLYRVRVGPERDRTAAVALGAKLRSAGHGGGTVVAP